jgi:hypothetical protein
MPFDACREIPSHQQLVRSPVPNASLLLDRERRRPGARSRSLQMLQPSLQRRHHRLCTIGHAKPLQNHADVAFHRGFRDA